MVSTNGFEPFSKSSNLFKSSMRVLSNWLAPQTVNLLSLRPWGFESLCSHKNKIMNKCQNCGEDTNNPKFCSVSCSAIYNNKLKPRRKLDRVCSKCSKVVKSYRHKLCEEHHLEYMSNRQDECKNRPLSYYWELDSVKKSGKASKNAHIRLLCKTWNKGLLLKPCEKCGYDKHVELCHIKPIHSFSETSTLGEINSENNVVQLCPNCHWEFDNGFLDIIK